MHEYQPLARCYFQAVVGYRFHENIMASARSAWRRGVQLNRKRRSRLVTRQCSTGVSALGTCSSRILDGEQVAIIWVFVAFLMLPSREKHTSLKNVINTRSSSFSYSSFRLWTSKSRASPYCMLSSRTVPRFARCVSSVACNLIG